MNHQQSSSVTNTNNNNNNNNIYEKVREILEFYLSDSNIRRDKYLLNLIKLNNEGYCKTLILNNDKKKIKRIQPFKEELTNHEIKEIDERTIYIEPITNDLSNNTLIESLFLKDKSIFNNNNNNNSNIDSGVVNSSPILHISIPRFPDKTIKGFSFIEFSSKEFAEKMINQIDQFPDQYNNLIAISKLEWLEKKKQFSYLSSKSRYLKINNIPNCIKTILKKDTEMNNNNNNNNPTDNTNNEDDDIKIIDDQTKPILMNKPHLWKFFDNETNISVCFLDYKAGNSEAILKFSTLSDLQYAIDQFQQGEIAMYDNVFHITEFTEKEINSEREKVSSHEVSKLKSNPYRNNNNNSSGDDNHNSADSGGYKKRNNYNNKRNYNNYENKRKRE
ncbi:hypothetical protein DICPUDRAFT_150883 [Dictyostelium purpureum]|uniref:HTH La-type RNA-binding domain-containing protein n=1 Tax=Dictyostelium purpureum TaxID=5786 RepID=F0ZHH7_DICPU|nr:uncharacterized protein DICPUDRAFT_150883 [Dictyostelium purpureum]EGC36634.1 hypothetical protein DICPUDRAFT_150883 [Dictyostelium purpureum]|eukprot:XP_003286872.1 hypothetical protein DICPUDRAFT_150883 [Dictyostelium purpureum]